MTMTKGQQEFLDQYTRKLMVDWCQRALTRTMSLCMDNSVFTQHAKDKKWISVTGSGQGPKIEIRILSSGWATAARFLKR